MRTNHFEATNFTGTVRFLLVEFLKKPALAITPSGRITTPKKK